MPKNNQSSGNDVIIGVITRLPATIAQGAASLFPGYFALVMATGVVSIACQQVGLRQIAVALIGVNWIAYVALWILTILRAARFPSDLWQDISDHERAPGFFTIVAGTCVLASQNVAILGTATLGIVLWWVGLILWFVIMYTFLIAVTVRRNKPSLDRAINGSWLIAVVATQAPVVLRGMIDPAAPPATVVQFQVIAMFLMGCMLYLMIIPLIFYRLTFGPFERQDFSPPYWINMGAVAITTLAGSTLLLQGDNWPLLGPLLPFLRGITFFSWAVASFWIPFLVALISWRYVWMRDRFTYGPAVWSMVFPLGMYTACTFQFAKAMGYDFLDPIPHVTIYIALTAWLLSMVGLLRQIGISVFRQTS